MGTRRNWDRCGSQIRRLHSLGSYHTEVAVHELGLEPKMRVIPMAEVRERLILDLTMRGKMRPQQ
jgi:hypothetical protein